MALLRITLKVDNARKETSKTSKEENLGYQSALEKNLMANTPPTTAAAIRLAGVMPVLLAIV